MKTTSLNRKHITEVGHDGQFLFQEDLDQDDLDRYMMNEGFRPDPDGHYGDGTYITDTNILIIVASIRKAD